MVSVTDGRLDTKSLVKTCNVQCSGTRLCETVLRLRVPHQSVVLKSAAAMEQAANMETEPARLGT